MVECSGFQLLSSLEDIATNIQIESNFCIRHLNYQSFSLPASIVAKFRQKSDALQQKYLTLLVRNFLYGIYYNGSLQTLLKKNGKAVNFLPHQNLENNSLLGTDWQFYEQLHAYNHGQGFSDSGWQVMRVEPDGSMAVEKAGLTLHVEPEAHVIFTDQYSQVNDYIAIGMPKNRLENGFYVALSNCGQHLHSDGELFGGRIYFNLTPEGAIYLMDSLTMELNQAEIPFTFKVPYHPAACDRYDCAVLHFERSHYPTIRKVLSDIYAKHHSYFRRQIPLFTKYLAPGVSLVEKPTQKFTVPESFGMNRCQIVANALIEAWEKQQNSSEERLEIIRQHFTHHKLDWQRPYLNPGSDDIYDSWN